MRPLSWAIFLLVLVGSCSPLYAAVPLAKGDDTRVQQAYEALTTFHCDRALKLLTGPYIEAMNSGDMRKAARYLLLMATAFRFDDNHFPSLICCRQAERLDPANLEAQTMTAEALIRMGRVAEGEEHLKPLLPEAKSNLLVCRALANLYAMEGDTQKTSDFAWAAWKLAPDDARPHVLLAKLNLQGDAVPQWQAAAFNVKNPYLDQLYRWQMELKKNPKQPNLAPLKEAAFLLPDEPSWRTSMAWYMTDKGDNEGAMKHMSEAVACPRFYHRAFSQLALYCAYHHQPALADASIGYALKIDPDAADLNFVMGQVCAAQFKIEQARQFYARTIAINNRQSVAYQALGSLLLYQNDYAKAQELAEQWVKNCPYLTEPWLFRAGLCRQKQKWSDGLSDYNQARERMKFAQSDKQKFKDLWLPLSYGAGTCAYKTGDQDLALTYAVIFNQLKPENAEDMIRVRPGRIDYEHLEGKAKSAAAHGLMADMLYEMAQFDDCIAQYKAAIQEQDNIEWHRGLLKAYMDKRDFTAASKEDIIVANHTVMSDVPHTIERLKKQWLP